MSSQARYAWIIDKDFLGSGENSEVGTIGPWAARDDLIDELRGGGGLTFKMYDDDRELVYVGRLVWFGETGDIPCRPLDDFGTPNAGCTYIVYPRHPEYDCG